MFSKDMQQTMDRERRHNSFRTALNVEAKVASLFQPDIIVPAQCFGRSSGDKIIEAERRLMLAILQDSIACFKNYLFVRDGKGRALFDDARDWILEENDDWVFSFDNICEALGFDAGFVRQRLLRWSELKRAEQRRKTEERHLKAATN